MGEDFPGGTVPREAAVNGFRDELEEGGYRLSCSEVLLVMDFEPLGGADIGAFIQSDPQ